VLGNSRSVEIEARQTLALFTLIRNLKCIQEQALRSGLDKALCTAAATYVAFIIDRVAERCNSITHWDAGGEFIQTDIGDGKIPMTWDFPESNPVSSGSGSWSQATEDALRVLEILIAQDYQPCIVKRTSALALPYQDSFFDAVVTDPPYYQNVLYSSLADFFYVLLKRSVGHLYPEHFAGQCSPTKAEVVMDHARHDGDADTARAAYEDKMEGAFREANRVLKRGAPMVCVYAHKTTAGWATLINALRKAGFFVTEAWPLDTENASRQRSKGAALASSIFLVSRKREGESTGQYEEQVRPELEAIVHERVETLWEMGISGADLVIACVGAGLRPFTRFARVEYANGEEVPAERFLTEVETVVLESILARLSQEVAGKAGQTSLVGMDPATRFYVLWRYTYGTADLDAGEAIIFANGTHVELDGTDGLTYGASAVLQKVKNKYHLREFTERGDNDTLGLPGKDGEPSVTVDALHRVLWLLEHRPPLIPPFLAKCGASLEHVRLLAQALAGPALKGGELADVSPSAEQAALGKLLANWNAVMEGKPATEDRQKGQTRFKI